MTPGRTAESGYALVTAVVAMAVLALMAATLTANGRGTAAAASAEAVQARLRAAADAGTVIAIRGLAATDTTRRWSIDGRPRSLRIDGVDLVVRIEDERGKIPLNQITDEQVRTMFEAIGLTGSQLDIAVDSFLDWRDDDDEARASGAEADWYAELGRKPRNGPLRTIDELVLVRGVTPDVVERLRPITTIYNHEREGFDDRYASSLVMAALNGSGVDTPAVLERAREEAGQRTAIALGQDESLVGRPLMIRVEAHTDDAVARRATVIELTGSTSRPYIVRRYE